MTRLIPMLLACTLAGLVYAADPAPAWIGVRGPEGSGVYPDAKPPTTWDLKTGKNVRWVVPLSGWGHGQPVVADGKVFLLLEPDVNHLFPRLQCLDLATGTALWEDEIDHLPVAEPDAAKRAEVYGQWKKYNQMMADCAVFEAEFMAAHKIGKPEKQAIIDRWKQRGYVPIWRLREATVDDGDNEPARLRVQLPPAEHSRIMKLLARYGYWEDIYQSTCNFSCIGHVFGAPIWCDGAVYVATAGGVFAKYSADGKRQWMTWSFNPGNTNLAGSGQDTCVRSPIVSGDLLISTAANNLVALDRATGGIRFKDTLPAPRNYESISTPAVMTVDGKGILLTAGPRAYRLPDGRPLKIEGWLISGMQALVKHDERDVVFFCGSGEHCTWPNKGFGIDTPPPAAVRYALEGDVLRGTVLWAGVQDPAAIATRANPAPPYSKVHDAGGEGGNAPWLLYDKGRLYHRDGAILDALTGKIVAGKLASRIPQDRAAPRTAHLLQLAGGYVYGWGNNLTDPVQVYTADGKFVAANPFVRPTLTKEQLPVWRGVDSSEGYGNMLSYGSQFTFGKDCLVMRTLMHLYCFSDGAQLPPPSPDR